MNMWLDNCRWLYNRFIEERKIEWENNKKSVSYNKQATDLPNLKSQHPEFKKIHSQVLQEVAKRVDLAYQAFFRRIRNKEKPGYPRFKGKNRYDSFKFSQSGFSISNDGQLILSKIGKIKLKQHRKLKGNIKNCQIKRTFDNKWYVYFVCDINETTVRFLDKNNICGIDVGIESFATFNSGEKIDNPRFMKHEIKELTKADRAVSKSKKGSKERFKTRKKKNKIHQRIKNKRSDWLNKLSKNLINSHDYIVTEDLKINKMLEKGHQCLNREINDVCWRTFIDQLSYKAEEAGKRVLKVNPAYTSQICSNCGHKEENKLSDRVHNCKCCKTSLDRDHNAAINILRLGLQSLGQIPRSR